ncbi:DNA-binding MurR/RpiR family transcriptional regulator [Paraburkholderia sp. WC7.3g]|uniref:hypothetical protein n=1 Tax=Paraburkholderia TaxID=1822464 RepID=UPI001CA3F153|nr:hypothetical protein [Paraburkholderia podalyriae]
MVAISNTGATRSLIEVVRTAKERAACVVLITGTHGPLRYCDVAVVTETLENTDVYTPITSRLAALVIVDILSTSVALRKGESHVRDVQGHEAPPGRYVHVRRDLSAGFACAFRLS